MRNLIIAAVLFVIMAVSAGTVSVVTCHRIEELTSMIDRIPAEKDEMEASHDECAILADALYQEWDHIFPYLTYITGYTALNRADDAVMELYCSIGTETYEDAVLARSKLLDALRRMREMETVSLSSIF